MAAAYWCGGKAGGPEGWNAVETRSAPGSITALIQQMNTTVQVNSLSR